MFNSNSDTLDKGILLLRRLHLLVDLRKRHAFDFLASLPDLDMYAPRPNQGIFNEDLEIQMSNEWNTQELDISPDQSDKPEIQDNVFNIGDSQDQFETLREDSQKLSFGGSLKESDQHLSRTSYEKVNGFNATHEGNFWKIKKNKFKDDVVNFEIKEMIQEMPPARDSDQDL